MTTTEAAFLDTWAWWEITHETATGVRLQGRFLERARPHTSAWALGELACKLALDFPSERVDDTVRALRQAAVVHDVTPELALAGARLRKDLRRKAPRASLGDGVMLATARHLGMRLVSGDAAFVGEPDVIR